MLVNGNRNPISTGIGPESKGRAEDEMLLKMVTLDQRLRRRTSVVPIDFKAAITEDLAEIDLALSILNCLRNVNLARLALLQERRRGCRKIGVNRLSIKGK